MEKIPGVIKERFYVTTSLSDSWEAEINVMILRVIKIYYTSISCCGCIAEASAEDFVNAYDVH